MITKATRPLVAFLLIVWFAAAVQYASAGTGGIGPGGTDSQVTRSGVFPLRAAHSYGDGIGAGRGHQGQDLMARCGKPVVAAQTGRVKLVAYQGSGAGNYVVIRGARRTFDYVYMHMLERASVREGQRVVAGDQIGLVGSTGRSTACHLHFEMWSAPGWYEGGSVEDPTPYLKSWDPDE